MCSIFKPWILPLEIQSKGCSIRFIRNQLIGKEIKRSLGPWLVSVVLDTFSALTVSVGQYQEHLAFKTLYNYWSNNKKGIEMEAGIILSLTWRIWRMVIKTTFYIELSVSQLSLSYSSIVNICLDCE